MVPSQPLFSRLLSLTSILWSPQVQPLRHLPEKAPTPALLPPLFQLPRGLLWTNLQAVGRVWTSLRAGARYGRGSRTGALCSCDTFLCFFPDILQPVFQIAGSPCQYFPLALALLSKATLEELLRLENAVFA